MGLTFRTGALVDAIYTDSSNKVGIGTSTLTAGIPLSINVTTGNNCNVAFQENASDKWYLRNITSSNAFSFYSVSGSTEVMRLSSAGNVGIGITPYAWNSIFLGIDFANKGGINSYTNYLALSQNLYYGSGALDGWRYKTTGYGAAITIESDSGSIVFRNTSSSGTADAAASSFAERMRITSGGNLLFTGGVSTGVTDTKFLMISQGTTSATYAMVIKQSNNSTNLLAIRDNGTFYTGTAAESPYNLTIASSANVFVFSDGALFRATSSARYKKDIEDINVDTFGLINKIRPVWYRSTTGNDRDDWSWYGFIAEELAEVDPRFVHFGYAPEDYIKDEETGKTELKEGAELRADGVMYDRLTVLLIKGMQEQKKLIDELSAKVTALENR